MAFVQDEITLVPNRFFLTVGTKLEHNYYTGFALHAERAGNVRPGPAQHDVDGRLESGSHARRYRRVDPPERSRIPGTGGTPALVSLIGNPRFPR